MGEFYTSLPAADPLHAIQAMSDILTFPAAFHAELASSARAPCGGGSLSLPKVNATRHRPRRPRPRNLSPIRYFHPLKPSKFNEKAVHVADYLYRYYDPLTGRWLSRDLIEERGGVNLCNINHNDNIQNIDYLGMSETLPLHRCFSDDQRARIFEMYNKPGQFGGNSSISIPYTPLKSNDIKRSTITKQVCHSCGNSGSGIVDHIPARVTSPGPYTGKHHCNDCALKQSVIMRSWSQNPFATPNQICVKNQDRNASAAGAAAAAAALVAAGAELARDYVLERREEEAIEQASKYCELQKIKSGSSCGCCSIIIYRSYEHPATRTFGNLIGWPGCDNDYIQPSGRQFYFRSEHSYIDGPCKEGPGLIGYPDGLGWEEISIDHRSVTF